MGGGVKKAGGSRGKEQGSSAMEKKTLVTFHLTNKRIRYVLLAASLLAGCGTLVVRDPAAPASHHAQRKYDEAVKRGDMVPAEEGKDYRK